MISYKIFSSIDEIQRLQYLATQSREEVGLSSMDGSIMIDAKSFIGLFGLDFSEVIRVVSEDLDFHKKIKNLGKTVEKP